MSETPRFDSYREKLQSTFSVKYTEEGVTTLKLVEASLTKFAPPGWESFSLEFHGTGEVLLHQGIWALKDEAGEEDPIFLVPIGQRDNGFRYQAIFNCAVPEKG